MRKHRILVVDDDPNILTTLGMRLEAMGYQVGTATDGKEAVEVAVKTRPHLVLLDLRLPRMDGLQALNEIKGALPDTAVILLTAQGSVETAVAAIKAGAYDYLEKPINSQRLGILLEQALSQRGFKREVGRLKSELKEMGRFGHMVGQSEPMQDLYRQIEQVADTIATVLVTGESGTGKELIARTVHDMSDRPDGPFVPVNSSAIMATLWESEIFGYEKGAFTGAHKRHHGYIEQAHGGTLFLDEVGEMSLDSQAKFLRVLETHRFKRVGGSEEVSVDMRVVAATNRDLTQAIAEGKFREDLYYRLNVFTLKAPPLRERRSDISLLTRTFLNHFIEAYGKNAREISEDAFARLRRYRWPGNVRELRNCIERAVIVATGYTIEARHLPATISEAVGEVVDTGGLPEGVTIAEVERRLILMALKRLGGNKTRAAKELGISLKTLHNKLGRYRQDDAEAQEAEG